jgi:hypothetical protein
MFYLIHFVADAFLLAVATVTIPSILIGLFSIAVNRHRNGQQQEVQAITPQVPEPQQLFARPVVSTALAEEFTRNNALTPMDEILSKPEETKKPATTPQLKAQSKVKPETSILPKSSKLTGSQRRAEQLKALLAAQQAQQAKTQPE